MNRHYWCSATQAALMIVLLTACSSTAFFKGSKTEPWDCRVVAKDGRIDAIADLGDGVLLTGSRVLNPGGVYRSLDHGKTWAQTARIQDGEFLGFNVTCLAAGRDGTAYLLTGNAAVWKSTDQGLTWVKMAKLSDHPRLEGFQRSYGMTVLDTGTVLVSNTMATGGHIFRSVNGGRDWTDLGPFSQSGLYRFQKTGDGVIVNGWAGHVFKSVDDGKSWTDQGQLVKSPLYATEYLGKGIVLQGSESGHVFRSVDNGRTWTDLGVIGDAADDFACFGDGRVLYTTYTGKRSMFLSKDWGETWTHIGPVPTGVQDDWFDHLIGIRDGKSWLVVGGTNKGLIARYFGP